MRRAIAYLCVFGIGGLFWAGANAYRSHQGIPDTAAATRVAPSTERPAFDPTLADRTVRFYEERVRFDPQGAISYAMLARAYERRSKEQGDPADLTRAESAARRSLQIRQANNAAACTALASALMGEHRFAEAREQADQAARIEAGNPQAEYLRAECDLETGRYEDATRDLNRAAVLTQGADPDPYYLALRARLNEIDGKADTAESGYRAALAAADKVWEIPRPTLAWFHARLANCLALRGQSEAAEAEYAAALQVWDRDARTMTALARLQSARGDAAGAITRAERSAHLVPAPETAMLLYDLYRRTGDPSAAARALDEALSGGPALHAHNRAQALFDADHHIRLDEAVALARADVATRPDIYSYDALAWALFAHGDLAGAEAASRRALSRGTRDALLFYHAGRIALAQGKTSEGNGDLTRALTLNPCFDYDGAAQARELLQHPVGETTAP